jgi:hypothetical protein
MPACPSAIAPSPATEVPKWPIGTDLGELYVLKPETLLKHKQPPKVNREMLPLNEGLKPSCGLIQGDDA